LAASLQTLSGVILPSDSIGFKGHTGVEALCGQEEKREGGKELNSQFKTPSMVCDLHLSSEWYLTM